MKESQKMISRLQTDENLVYQIDESPKPLNGFKMDIPRISLGKKLASLFKGSINLKERILDPFTFQEMIFCYSLGKYADDDRADADDALALLQKASSTFGIQFKEPIWVEIKGGDNIQNWYSGLLEEKKKQKKKPDIIFLFVSQREEKFYGELKKFISKEFGCPSQFATKKKLTQKSSLSVASKIAMQMNAKMGHSLWKI